MFETCRHHRKRGPLIGAVASLAALTLVLAGCSSDDSAEPAPDGGGSEQDAISSMLDSMPSELRDAMSGQMPVESGAGGGGDSGDLGDSDLGDGDGDADEEDDASAGDPPEIQVHLPQVANDPNGWQRLPSRCDDPDGAGYVTYAVPGDWERGGLTSGSASPTNMGFKITWRSDEGDVAVDIDSDSRDPEGQLTHNGEPVEDPTFDYDSKVGDDEARITYDSLGDIDVAEQQGELFVLKPDQAPDHVRNVEYKVRLHNIDMPAAGFAGEWTLQPSSFVIAISYNPEKRDLSEDTVRTMIESLVMPACSVQHAVVQAELMYGVDLDGDGHVSDQEDYMEVLQADG